MRGRSLLVGCVVGAVVASAVGVAYAAIPDNAGTIHACYQNVTSANKPLKLLDTAKTTACPSGWKAVTWNQKGQQGVPGTNGTNGVSGYQTVTVSVSATNGDHLPGQANCPAGKVPVGGGFSGPGGGNTTATTDAPQYVLDGNNNVIGGGWLVDLASTSVNFQFGPGFVLHVYVICVAAS
ncbi:MAG TPA: hypothetical protein VLK79_14525 [Gaiellales bacterium]|nr:hypothetical protein [Gaiellales bacterium]